MKFNWGTGILIFIIFFFIAIFSFVYFTTTHDINLVEEDYYPRELAYDSQQEKMTNTANLSEKIDFEKSREMIRLVFPGFVNTDSIHGTIVLYRPSDHRKDLRYQISPDTASSQVISAGELLPGKYIIKVDWSYRDKSYYQEEVYLH